MDIGGVELIEEEGLALRNHYSWIKEGNCSHAIQDSGEVI